MIYVLPAINALTPFFPDPKSHRCDVTILLLFLIKIIICCYMMTIN